MTLVYERKKKKYYKETSIIKLLFVLPSGWLHGIYAWWLELSFEYLVSGEPFLQDLPAWQCWSDFSPSEGPQLRNADGAKNFLNLLRMSRFVCGPLYKMVLCRILAWWKFRYLPTFIIKLKLNDEDMWDWIEKLFIELRGIEFVTCRSGSWN